MAGSSPAKGDERLGMLYFANWKVLLICGVCALGLLFSLPNLLSPAQLSWLPASIPHKQVSLGLDLAAAQRDQLNSLVDNVRDTLRNEKIGYTGLNVQGNAIVFTVRDTDR